MLGWLMEGGLDKSSIAFGGDSTNVNTGVNARVIRKMEPHLGR